MDIQTRKFVHRRAEHRCEYCHLPQEGHVERFSVDHVIPRKHHGSDGVDNLALSCLRCNLCKGSNLSGVDPHDGNVISLFDPRRQIWSDHFFWNDVFLQGLTPTGRATVDVLRPNELERVELRRSLKEDGIFNEA